MLEHSTEKRLKELANATERYVGGMLHVSLELQPWSATYDLPPYLLSRYVFLRGGLAGVDALWMLARSTEKPLAVQKHADVVRSRFEGAVIVVFGQLSAYARGRLVEQGVAFVVPNAQMYLPHVGLDFRRKTASPQPDRARLRPSAQLLFLHMLLDRSLGEYRLVPAADLLGYTVMTMSRAVRELEAAGLIDVTRRSRELAFCLPGKARQVWEYAQKVLASPVKRRILAEVLPQSIVAKAPLAGLSALGEYTMLQAPAMRTIAVSSAGAKGIPSETDEQGERPAAEVWHYDPQLLSGGPNVDRFSLFLSLRDDSDERVQSALGEMLEDYEW